MNQSWKTIVLQVLLVATLAPVVTRAILCAQCTRFANGKTDPFCIQNQPVDPSYVQVGQCDDACFTRSDPINPQGVSRGCTSFEKLPKPLPKDGCYDWHDTTMCISKMDIGNFQPLGKSSGVALDAHLQDGTKTDGPLQCYQCLSDDDEGNHYPQCLKNEPVQPATVYRGNCSDACFTRSDPKFPERVYRGCSTYQYGLPVPIPEDGCYDWNGAVFCICTRNGCNAPAIGKSSGVRLDDHLQRSYNSTDKDENEGPLQCYQCINYDLEGKYYSQCPKNDRVIPAITYRDNCTGVCFTRSDSHDPKKVYRGCTDSQYGLPERLPKDGCYNWDGAVYCICRKHSCNGRAIEPSNGKDLDYLLDLEDYTGFEEPDGKRRCYQCTNYGPDGTYYRQCPKNKRVRNAYLDVCNGTCFTRSYDYDHRKIARGCTDSQYNLPNPLPSDGCYPWYSEVWCVCSTSRCNGKAIGEPQNIEFDAHIIDGGGSASTLCPFQTLLALACFGVLLLVSYT